MEASLLTLLSAWFTPDPAAPAPPAVLIDLQPQGVVGGEVVPDGVWPDAVALLAAGDLMCTGVLVAPDLVLTAAHCWWAEQVIVGTADLSKGGQLIEVADAVQHEDFFNTFDVAVLVLAEPATGVPPRLLAVDCFANRIAADAPVDVVGFGAINRDGTVFAPQLRAGHTVITDPDCLDFEAGCNAEVAPGGELLAGGEGVDSCFGDSGGPLYLLGDDGDTLAGITSRGLLGQNPPCGAGGIYVRADAIDPWLQDQGFALPRPACEGNQPPVPSAPDLSATVGLTAAVVITPRDPDAEQTHTYTIVGAPSSGFAHVDRDDGLLVYLAPDQPVETSVTVEVTDDGDPPLTGTVTITLQAMATGNPQVETGCATTPAAPWLFGMVLATLLRRRSP